MGTVRKGIIGYNEKANRGYNKNGKQFIITSPNEVFGDIMVLASPPRPYAVPTVSKDSQRAPNVLVVFTTRTEYIRGALRIF